MAASCDLPPFMTLGPQHVSLVWYMKAQDSTLVYLANMAYLLVM